MSKPEIPDTTYDGEFLFTNEPELLVAEVWHRAAKLYHSRDSQMEFVNGYINARRRRDEKNSDSERVEKK